MCRGLQVPCWNYSCVARRRHECSSGGGWEAGGEEQRDGRPVHAHFGKALSVNCCDSRKASRAIAWGFSCSANRRIQGLDHLAAPEGMHDHQHLTRREGDQTKSQALNGRDEDNHLLPLMRVFPREVKQRPSPHASPTLQIEVAPDSHSYYFICGPAYSNPVSAWLVFHGAPGSKLRKLINVWRLNCHLPRRVAVAGQRCPAVTPGPFARPTPKPQPSFFSS